MDKSFDDELNNILKTFIDNTEYTRGVTIEYIKQAISEQLDRLYPSGDVNEISEEERITRYVLFKIRKSLGLEERKDPK